MKVQASLQVPLTQPFKPLTGHPLISASACEQCMRELLLMDAFWLRRHPHLPFFTLGATNYYDIEANGLAFYLEQAKRYNMLLTSSFTAIYQQLLSLLTDVLNEDVWLDTHNAVPGFHIFSGHPEFQSPENNYLTHTQWLRLRNQSRFIGSPVHRDRVHEVIDWQGRKPAFGTPTAAQRFSFTLPIVLPEAGGGLNIWPNAKEGEACGEHNRQFYAYTPGELVLHSGDEYHQASGFPLRENEYRITLQGHGLRWQNGWSLFW